MSAAFYKELVTMDDIDHWDVVRDIQTLAAVRDRLRALGIGDLGVKRCVNVVHRVLATQARKAGICCECLALLDDMDATGGRDGHCMLCTAGIVRKRPDLQLTLDVIDV